MISAEDRLAITALYAEYNRAIDTGEAHAWAATFIGGGIFHHPARIWTGSEDLRRFVIERNDKIAIGPIVDQRHWNDPVALDGHGDVATGACALLVSGVERDGGRAVVVARGHYADRLMRTAQGWRFAERRLTVA